MSENTFISQPIYAQYLQALLSGERELCSKIVQECSAHNTPLKDLYVDLFQRSMYQVGDLWEQQQISVAAEHLATAMTERLMTNLQPQLFRGLERGKSIIVACVADEYHQLGGRMVADVAETQGWRGYFLGANTPKTELLKMIDERKPTLLALSLSLYFNLPEMIKAVDAVSADFPDLPVLVGGQAFRPRWGGVAALENYPGVIYASTLDDLEKILAAHG